MPSVWRIFARIIKLMIILLLLVSAGCDDQAAAARQQQEQGAALYQMHCARCHGEDGAGGQGPPIIGPRHGLGGYETAQGLYNYTSLVMPNDTPGVLTPEEHWDVLAYILQANDFLPENTVLGPDNATALPLHKNN